MLRTLRYSCCCERCDTLPASRSLLLRRFPTAIRKSFYIYENGYTLTNQLSEIVVKGTFDGVEKSYPPLQFRDGAGNPISIKRSHIYRVMLGDKPTGELTAKLNVEVGIR